MLIPTLFSWQKNWKYIKLEYGKTQIIDEYTGNELFFDTNPKCSTQEALLMLLIIRDPIQS